MLDWVVSPNFLGELNILLKPLPVLVDGTDHWMPRGWEDPAEARLETFGPKYFGSATTWKSLQSWWLAHEDGANTPNWDFASTCTIDGQRGLLLMEAKANLPELSTAGKVLRSPRTNKGEDDRREPSQKSKANHEKICAAVAEAGRALAGLGLTSEFTAASHYQLANRLAFSWKLASLGVPVALTYLGFCGDKGLTNVGLPFTDAANWYDALKAHALPLISIERPEFSASAKGLPLWFAVRSRPVLTQSPPVAV